MFQYIFHLYAVRFQQVVSKYILSSLHCKVLAGYVWIYFFLSILCKISAGYVQIYFPLYTAKSHQVVSKYILSSLYCKFSAGYVQIYSFLNTLWGLRLCQNIFFFSTLRSLRRLCPNIYFFSVWNAINFDSLSKIGSRSFRITTSRFHRTISLWSLSIKTQPKK